jgi:hypothetical protein
VGVFLVVVDVDLAAGEAWRRVLDLRMHSRVIPLTTVTGDALSADELGRGSRFVARTALGPMGFDDPMVVDDIREPAGGGAGVARIHKEGKVIRGWIELRVTPLASGSRVEWDQDIRVRWVPTLLEPVAAQVARAAYGTAIRRLLRG